MGVFAEEVDQQELPESSKQPAHGCLERCDDPQEYMTDLSNFGFINLCRLRDYKIEAKNFSYSTIDIVFSFLCYQ